jgi:hypothetical protein
MDKLISAYKHVELYGGRKLGKASSYYKRATSYQKAKGGYIVNDALLPKHIVCPKCSIVISQKCTQGIISVLRKGNGRCGVCPNKKCSYLIDSLESAFCSY